VRRTTEFREPTITLGSGNTHYLVLYPPITSKYTIARELIDQLHQYADSNGLDKTDVEEATLILLIQALKNSRGSESMRGLLQYEIDNLGTSVFEIQRGSGHS